MKKVLFMPFLQIPSGHHQVADALTEIISKMDQSIKCEKVDILNYSYGRVERMISKIYIKWIHSFPKTYHWIYHKLVCDNLEKDKHYHLYEFLFLPFVKRLIREIKPDLIVCSHALPSYMLNKLKHDKLIDTPVINVYTDYFIHSFWGTSHIDYHFVSHSSLRTHLLEKGIDKTRIFVTGIPTHPAFHKKIKEKRSLRNCTVMGGSLGVGVIDELLPKLVNSKNMTFTVLCGKNKKLFETIRKLGNKKIKAYGYITNRKEMNKIYENTDVVITKPGGITISECLTKGIPALIYHTLPGQEKINLNELSSYQLVFKFDHWKEMDSIEEGIYEFFREHQGLRTFSNNLKQFQDTLEKQSLESILKEILYS
ncbi:MGDG synthase family glycosyltransferase [Litchfieldia salsa]|uniref:UDP-N-acetylglucosamine:LPS N-acetylglucosamine transferase n=1 Tax=Litchfieldia salsa TaxID=930152 RepID=A0A1H0TFE5_9BACI|nr:glycosyltransferase [Litchfieldia salsa]SDP52714.1 UDP-N-acetylglucosamine:LPS N-acetylglucosamine transferase [Litchfieldia salsa]